VPPTADALDWSTTTVDGGRIQFAKSAVWLFEGDQEQPILEHPRNRPLRPRLKRHSARRPAMVLMRPRRFEHQAAVVARTPENGVLRDVRRLTRPSLLPCSLGAPDGLQAPRSQRIKFDHTMRGVNGESNDVPPVEYDAPTSSMNTVADRAARAARVASAAVFTALVTSAACGGGTSVAPSTPCISNRGPIFGFTVDRSTLTGGVGVNLRIGERARVRVTVERPSITNFCQSPPAFTYMKWTWNWRQDTSQESKVTPQTGPIDVTLVSCNCRLFGEPYWNPGATGGAPFWEQRAWLDGEQTVEFDVRAVSVGSTPLSVTGFIGQPFPTTNPVGDVPIYQSHLLGASVIP
jgi:hypothetical protein